MIQILADDSFENQQHEGYLSRQYDNQKRYKKMTDDEIKLRMVRAGFEGAIVYRMVFGFLWEINLSSRVYTCSEAEEILTMTSPDAVIVGSQSTDYKQRNLTNVITLGVHFRAIE